MGWLSAIHYSAEITLHFWIPVHSIYIPESFSAFQEDSNATAL